MLAMCNSIKSAVSTYTARLMLGLCSRIFRYGVACGYVTSDPCRDLSGALPSHSHRPMAALVKPKDIARLLKAIDVCDGDFKTLCALRFLPLCMVRTGELRQTEWSEVDFDEKLWCVPAEHTKLRGEHLVPLSREALEILRDLKVVTGHCRYLLPRRRSDSRIMSGNTVNAAQSFHLFLQHRIFAV